MRKKLSRYRENIGNGWYRYHFTTEEEAEAFIDGVEFVNDKAIQATPDPDDHTIVEVWDMDAVNKELLEKDNE